MVFVPVFCREWEVACRVVSVKGCRRQSRRQECPPEQVLPPVWRKRRAGTRVVQGPDWWHRPVDPDFPIPRLRPFSA
jgi:hypothetical protein